MPVFELCFANQAYPEHCDTVVNGGAGPCQTLASP
jgi:hypothetical protein